MRKHVKHWVAAIAIVAMGQSAFAAGQTSALNGFDVNLGMDFVAASSKQVFVGGTQFYNYGGQSSTVSIGGGYSHSFGRFNLGVHASLMTGEVDAGGEGYPSDDSSEYDYSLKLKSVKELSIEPGLVFGSNVVGYLKIASVSGDLVQKVNYPYYSLRGDASSSVSTTALGLGMRAKLTQHWFMSAEMEQAEFSNKTSSIDVTDGTYDYGSIDVKNKLKMTHAAVKFGLLF